MFLAGLQTRLELLNIREAPAHLQPQRAPPHPQQPVCQLTGGRWQCGTMSFCDTMSSCITSIPAAAAGAAPTPAARAPSHKRASVASSEISVSIANVTAAGSAGCSAACMLALRRSASRPFAKFTPTWTHKLRICLGLAPRGSSMRSRARG